MSRRTRSKRSVNATGSTEPAPLGEALGRFGSMRYSHDRVIPHGDPLCEKSPDLPGSGLPVASGTDFLTTGATGG